MMVDPHYSTIKCLHFSQSGEFRNKELLLVVHLSKLLVTGLIELTVYKLYSTVKTDTIQL